MLAKIDDSFSDLDGKHVVELHSHAPWWIARYQQNLENTAFHHLRRAGFEHWTPTFKNVRQMPLSKVPPKKRKHAKSFLQQVRKKRFPGYVFIRRAFGSFDINRLFDLRGCGSVVTVSGSAALVKDFDVELMRVAEADGTFDVYQFNSMPMAYFKVDWIKGDDGLKQQWDSIGPTRCRLDDSRRLSLSSDAFGRVSHLIASADPA
jgi:transcription antitermination factor NusG